MNAQLHCGSSAMQLPPTRERGKKTKEQSSGGWVGVGMGVGVGGDCCAESICATLHLNLGVLFEKCLKASDTSQRSNH